MGQRIEYGQTELTLDDERFLIKVCARLEELMDLMESGMSMEDAMKKLKWGSG